MHSRFYSVVAAIAIFASGARAASFSQGPLATGHTEAADRLAPMECSRGIGELRSKLWDGYTLRIGPATDERAAVACQADINDGSGHSVYETGDAVLRLHPASGSDINQDGRPEIVIEAYAGGPHCCWTYSVLSPSGSSTLLAEVMNEVPFEFRHAGDGSTEIWTRDGGFDYFETSHKFSPMPLVVLRLRGRQWINASSEHRGDYDGKIAEARRRLTPRMLREFLRLRPAEVLSPKFDQTKYLILSIVLNYLYSGREKEAWTELAGMWPKADQPRIRASVLSARANGLLSRLHAPVHPAFIRANWLEVPESHQPSSSQSAPFGR